MRTSHLDRDSAAAVAGDPPITQHDQAKRPQFIAVVEGLEGVRYVALAESMEDIWARLCAHVRTWSPYQLDQAQNDRVMRALEAGQCEVAVKLYFAHGGRWEPEKLLLRALARDGTAHFRA